MAELPLHLVCKIVEAAALLKVKKRLSEMLLNRPKVFQIAHGYQISYMVTLHITQHKKMEISSHRNQVVMVDRNGPVRADLRVSNTGGRQNVLCIIQTEHNVVSEQGKKTFETWLPSDDKWE